MNHKAILRINSQVILIETALMIVPLIICLCTGDMPGARGFLSTILIGGSLGGLTYFLTLKAKSNYSARDGLVAVGLAWILMSLVGALPFFISRAIPNYVDCFFEIASGFSTTGSSILTDVEHLTKGILFWRSFSHFIGGMGMLVFLLAVIPTSGKAGGFSVHILRAESPGPAVGKLVPKMKQTALILYAFYAGLTLLDAIMLKLGGLTVFESACLAFGTAGTGGFGLLNSSIGEYSDYIQIVCTVFMYLFGVNFTLYYYLLMRKFSVVFADEELRMYLATIAVSVTIITINLRGFYDTIGERIKHAAFQVAAVMTTTGFSTADFDTWPTLSKGLMLCLMLMGACAGSTGGGFKIIRVLLLGKTVRRNTHKLLNPREVATVRYNGASVSEKIIESIQSYLVAYVAVMIVSFLILSIDKTSVLTNLTAVISAVNNIGPGLETVGPTGNYAGFSVLSKIVLSMDMLIGRLEIFPILILFTRSAWKRA